MDQGPRQGGGAVDYFRHLKKRITVDPKIMEDEHAQFCEANHNYMQFYYNATAGGEEYERMHSAATRPSEAAPGSITSKILLVPDPKSQKTIDSMDNFNRKRFNDSTKAEKDNFFMDPEVAQRILVKNMPQDADILNTLCVWITKWKQAVYDKTKARIVVRGDQMKKGAENTFAPTVRFVTMLILFCLAGMFGWRVDKIDYSQAFLNAKLPQPIYARFPPGLREYDAAGNEIGIVFFRAAYGITTAPRLWNQTQDQELRDELGYCQHKSDACVYSQSWAPLLENVNPLHDTFNPHDFLILANHVDDGAVFTPGGAGNIVREREIPRLLSKYKGTDEGLLTDYCGVRVTQHEGGIDLDQEMFIESLLTKWNLNDVPGTQCPIKEVVDLADMPSEIIPKIRQKYWEI